MDQQMIDINKIEEQSKKIDVSHNQNSKNDQTFQIRSNKKDNWYKINQQELDQSHYSNTISLSIQQDHLSKQKEKPSIKMIQKNNQLSSGFKGSLYIVIILTIVVVGLIFTTQNFEQNNQGTILKQYQKYSQEPNPKNKATLSRILQANLKKQQPTQNKQQTTIKKSFTNNLQVDKSFLQQLQDSQLLYDDNPNQIWDSKQLHKYKQKLRQPNELLIAQANDDQQQITYQSWWPKPNIKYHIITAHNHEFVLEIAGRKNIDGNRDLLLNNWQNKWNKKFFLQAKGDNKFRIFNLKGTKTMKINPKKCQELDPNVYFSIPSNKTDQLWELVPVTYFDGQYIKTKGVYFYIKSSCGKYLNYLNSPGRYKALIQSLFNQQNHQNIWYMREQQQTILQKAKNKDKQKNKQKANNQQGNDNKQTQKSQGTQQQTDQEEEQQPKHQIDIYYKPFTTIIQKLIVYDNPKFLQWQVKLQQLKVQMKDKLKILPQWMLKPMLQMNPKDLPPLPYDQNDQISGKKLKRVKQFKSQISISNCPQNHIVAYIWFGSERLPTQYSNILQKCKSNTRLLNEQDFLSYSHQWNIQNPHLTINPQTIDVRQQINQLKLLYLFYESGIYADFDTQINEQCFEGVISDEIIWTNHIEEGRGYTIWMPIKEILVPEENFMIVLNKFNPQVKRMLQNQIKETRHMDGGGRWKQCKYRQCLIVNCQRHLRDNTYKKGFD